MVRYMNSLNVYKHIRDKAVSSNLANNLREQYGRRSMRVIKGDTIKVLRGEYSGIEGKVEKVNTKRATLAIEGVQREKIRGGNVKVPIHASNVQIVALKLVILFGKRRSRGRSKKIAQQVSEPGIKRMPKPLTMEI